MSATIKAATFSAMTTAAGSFGPILGKMAGLSWQQWLLISGAVAIATIAGSLAALGQILTSPSITDKGKRAARITAATALAAQFLIGIVFAAQVDGNIWLIVPFCLSTGWGGTAFLKRLAEKNGLTKDDE